MAVTQLLGFLCYNNADLFRDGYIEQSLTRVYDVKDFNIFKLNNKPPKGINYTVQKDQDGNITSILEKRILLPANKLKMEMRFSKTMKNAVTNPINIDVLAGFASIGFGTAWNVGIGLLPAGMGGITQGTTEITFQVLDAETKINIPIKITKEIKDKSIINFEGYPISFFGIVKEHKEEGLVMPSELVKKWMEEHPQSRLTKVPVPGSDSFTYTMTVGLDFTPDQIRSLGRFSNGSYEGGPRKRVEGATNDDGQFGAIASSFVDIFDADIDKRLYSDQENIFVKIIRDPRKLKFRGDNRAGGNIRYYPFESKDENDATDHNILIKTDKLKEGDIIYLTYSIVSDRHLRQAIRHIGKVGQGNQYGVLGWRAEIGSELDIFNFAIEKWIVPKKVFTTESPDGSYKLTLSEYINIKDINNPGNKFDVIEGWRMSNVLTEKNERYWAADYRGILLVSKLGAFVVFPVEKIRDKDWFLEYVSNLDFVDKHIGADGSIIIDNIIVEIEKKLKIENLAECPIDIGNPSNSLLFDREKIPYYRPFAEALQKISFFKSGDKNSGVGLPCLDILYNYVVNKGLANAGDYFKIAKEINNIIGLFKDAELEKLDLSNAVFKILEVVPIKSQECNGEFVPHAYNYSCHTYDSGGGTGVYLSRSYIENQVLEWRGAGTIESYWQLETPYFCGVYNRKSRIWVERVGGNSIDNWSWIYVDTYPDFPHSISMDKDQIFDKSYLAFLDNSANDSLSYHVFSDTMTENNLRYMIEDINKTHERSFLYNSSGSEINYSSPSSADEDRMIEVHKEQLKIGYSQMMGDSPSYSKGVPLTNDVSYVCKNNLTSFWQEVDFLNGYSPEGKSYNLDFSDKIPRIRNIPSNWAIKELIIEYKLKTAANIPDKSKYITLFFEDYKIAINNLFFSAFFDGMKENPKITIKCQYYSSSVIQLISDYWQYIDIISVKGRVVEKTMLNLTKINEGQMSIVVDDLGRIMVFFADTLSGNISVAISYNSSVTWSIHRDILRLVDKEVATFPVVIKDAFTSVVHLFYVLNEAYLMYKPIDTNLFVEEDVFKKYTPPSLYDQYTLDDDDVLETSSIHSYTDFGKALRRESSYFVCGNSNEAFFKEQMVITNAIKGANKTDPMSKISIRYNFSGNEKELDDFYNGRPFCVHVDNHGVKRLFFVDNDLLTIKVSNNFISWKYLLKAKPFHKDYRADDLIKEESKGQIKNIQIIRNYFDESYFYLLYFHNEMLFIRKLYPSLLNSDIVNEQSLINYLLMVSTDASMPIYLMGRIPEDIKNKIIEEKNNKVPIQDSVLSISIPYPVEVIKNLDDRYAVDVDTQPFGYMLSNGNTRVFYKDTNDNMNAILLRGGIFLPEIFLVTKKGI